MTDLEAYHELCCYTLSHWHPSFIHQHVVDAFAVQHADRQTKPIALTFGLIGLYLHVERGFTGRNVQRVHMDLGKQKHTWPDFELPDDRGDMTALHVLAAPPGPDRDRAIDEWCESVWEAFQMNRERVVQLLRQHGM
ncbi:MAG: hypothetical protein JSS02_00205 [Planctomycetes bacterium]|nr:hypothetical protein [Planctomycetota bacterium]